MDRFLKAVIEGGNDYEEGVLCGKARKITPHIPYYLAEGNVLLKKWKEDFQDRAGNRAVLTKVLIRTKKGQENEYTIQVEWGDK